MIWLKCYGSPVSVPSEFEEVFICSDDDSDTGIVRENDKVKVNLLTTEATPKPTRTTTTPWPTTKGKKLEILRHLNLTFQQLRNCNRNYFG